MKKKDVIKSYNTQSRISRLENFVKVLDSAKDEDLKEISNTLKKEIKILNKQLEDM